MRIAVGISKNFTDPTAIRRLMNFSEVKIVPDMTLGIFHPKYYCFHSRSTKCWVGSLNLTSAGFGSNSELAYEFIQQDQDQEWFEQLWHNLPDHTEIILENYEKIYNPPKRTHYTHTEYQVTALPSLTDIESWDQFIDGLRELDAYCHQRDFSWDILGETRSYLHTINVGRGVISLDDWSKLTLRECDILRGFHRKNDHEGAWGLLGRLPMGSAPYVFNPKNMPAVGVFRQQIRDRISQVFEAEGAGISIMAQNAVQEIWHIKPVEGNEYGVGPAAATRWLTLARPDRLVSVNGKSAKGLGRAAGLPRTVVALSKRYSDLLGWVYSRPWFNAACPDDPFGRQIWNCRVALLDAFVYLNQPDIEE